MNNLILCSLSKPCFTSSHRLPFPLSATEFSSLSSAQEIKGGAWNISERYDPVRYQQNLIKCQIPATNKRSIFYQRNDQKFVVHAGWEQPLESEHGDFSPTRIQTSLKASINAFYKFLKPYTLIGITLSVMSASLHAIEKLSDFSPIFYTGVWKAIVPALMMNIYVNGLNQLTDIEIDKVNKPYLPLASGELSVGTGVIIVTSFAIMSFWTGWIVGSWPLFWALFIYFVLGTAYSINLPMLRWKRFAVGAAMCIVTNTVALQLAFYLHFKTFVYRRPAVFSKSVILSTVLISFFAAVMALLKDIPDIVGDKAFGIRSFTMHLGPKRVFWICISLLEMAYLVAILVGATSCCLWSKLITVGGHAILGSVLWNRAKSVDFESTSETEAFFMFIWKLYYAEYLLIPLVR